MPRNPLAIVAFAVVILPLLALDAGPSAAETLRPAFHIGGNPVTGVAPEYQLDAAVAAHDGAYLVVWSDPRALGSYDIYGGRFEEDGTGLDPYGITISTATGVQEKPAVAFGADNYFVVWKDDRNGSSDIYGARVAADGSVLDGSGIAVSTATGGQGYPAVGFGDSLYLVAWLDTRDGSQHLWGARVALDGTVLDPEGIAISTASGAQTYPAVAHDGANFLVVWQDARGTDLDIYGARVTPQGDVLDSSGIAISTASGDQSAPAVAWGGADYLVSWEDDRGGTYGDIYAARVSPAGAVLDAGGIQVCGQAADQSNAAASSDGARWLVVWNDLRGGSVWNVYAARVDSAGTVLDADGFAVCTDFSHQFAPSVAFADSIFLLAWHDSRNGPKDIYGIRVRPDATVAGSATLLSTAATYQTAPALSFDGANYLAVWQDARLGSGSDIYGVRVATDETVLDAEAIAVSAGVADETAPAGAGGGGGWLVAWQDLRGGTSDIYASRVAASGSVLDPAGVAISAAAGAQEYPDVASDGTGYLVVWQDARSGSYDIYGARVDSAGTVLDAGGLVICAATADQLRPTVAFDGANYLVAWQDLRGGAAYDIYGARVSPAGAVLDPAGIAISTATGAQECPAAVFNGAGYLVVWQDKRGGPYCDIYAARLATDGTVLDSAGLAISTASYDQLYPTLAFEGAYWVVAWQDMRRLATRPDIFAARVDTTGVVLDAAGFIVSNEAYSQLAPAASSGLAGQTVIAYSSFTHAPAYGSSRIWANSYGTASGVPWDGLPGEPAKRLVITPNPAVGQVAFEIRLGQGEPAALRIFDVRGRLVATLLDEVGRAEDMRNVEIESDVMAPGIYFCRLEHGGRAEVHKLVVLR